MEFPSTSDIDLNSTLSAGVSVNLLDPGFRTCGEHSLVVTVIATDGTKEFVKKEMIPFNRDEEYCQVTSFSSSSGAKKVACYGQGACMEADASKSSDCGKNDKSAIVLASCPAGGEICDLSKMGIDDMMLYIYPESKYDCAFYKVILANAPIEDLSGN